MLIGPSELEKVNSSYCGCPAYDFIHFREGHCPAAKPFKYQLTRVDLHVIMVLLANRREEKPLFKPEWEEIRRMINLIGAQV